MTAQKGCLFQLKVHLHMHSFSEIQCARHNRFYSLQQVVGIRLNTWLRVISRDVFRSLPVGKMRFRSHLNSGYL